MDIWLIVALVIGGAFLYRLVMGDENTRLFRRIWSSEKLIREPHMEAKQSDAMDALIAKYGIVELDNKQAFYDSTRQLFIDAINFDFRNPRNFGVEVAPVIAREMNQRFPKMVPDEMPDE